MEKIEKREETGMVAVHGLDSERVTELCKVAAERSGKPIQIASYLSKSHIVVGGHDEALEVVLEIGEGSGFKAEKVTKVEDAGGAFYTHYMKEAETELLKELEYTTFEAPRI